MEYHGEAPDSDNVSSQPSLPPLPKDHWRNDIDVHTFGPNDEPTTTCDVDKDPLDDFMYFHFRFTSHLIEQSSQPSPRERNEIRVVLVDQMSPVSEKHQGAIIDFVKALLMGKSPSPESWDLKDPDLLLLQEWCRHHFVDVKTFKIGRASCRERVYLAV